MRALCIDDHAINRQVLVSMLSAGGIVTDEAESGQSGLAMIEAASYDLIFMDLRMPAMDGIEAATRIRSFDSDKRRTPIILVTAEARVALGEGHTPGLFDETLTKPIKPEILFDAIARVLMASGAQTV